LLDGKRTVRDIGRATVPLEIDRDDRMVLSEQGK
jgi:hypothetical protein